MQRSNTLKINNPKLIRSKNSKVSINNNSFLIESKVMKKMKTKKVKKISFIRLLLLLLAICAMIFGLYFFLKTSYVFMVNLSKTAFVKVGEIKEDRNLKQFEKTEVIQVESRVLSQEDVIKSLSGVIDLPKEDMRMFAKVKDPLSLEKESNFYKGIKKGDYIVVYPSLAVIYDAEQEMIIRSMPLK